MSLKSFVSSSISKLKKSTSLTEVGNFEATGGKIHEFISSGVTYRVHTFNGPGTFSVQRNTQDGVDYLLVAGGGGSGASGNTSGGGGAGQLLEGTGLNIPTGDYTITVGGGGALQSNGSNTTGLGLTAFGGGHGGSGQQNGAQGGSGGGGSSPSESNGGSGTANTGSGGGASSTASYTSKTGGNGGSGIVVIRYEIAASV
jgi:hypothetical protein